MALFPLIESPTAPGSGIKLPLFREVAWDFSKNIPIWRGGEPAYCSGSAAVHVWAWNTLHAEKGLHDVFTLNHGLGIREGLTGKPYTDDVRTSEAVRYVRDALLVNPYITAVESVSVTFEESTLTVKCRLQTIYGEVNLDGCKL